MEGRVRALNDRPVRAGDYVLYWMQQSQRAAFNQALEHAVAQANTLSLPVLVGFGLTTAYPEANLRHFAFMIDGLAEIRRDLEKRGIAFVVRLGSPEAVAVELARPAALVVCDCGYLRHQREWRMHVSGEAACSVVQVEGDAVVPVDIASPKHEVAARTFRPKVLRLIDEFLLPCPRVKLRRPATALQLASDIDLRDPAGVLHSLAVDRAVAAVPGFAGGTRAARRHLERFIAHGLATYGSERSRTDASLVSMLGPYLHFGHISPVEVALAVREAAPPAVAGAFIEQLVVRRELAINHVWYAHGYDRYDGLPAWALKTLAAHRRDRRAFRYERAAFEASATHEPVWNAAMAEMRHTGTLHNRLRMYWGKKIVEWSADPRTAFDIALALNNRYLLDGRDANSYANIGWLFGLHDRPWPERPVLGNVRAQGLNSLKGMDLDAYVARIARLN